MLINYKHLKPDDKFSDVIDKDFVLTKYQNYIFNLIYYESYDIVEAVKEATKQLSKDVQQQIVSIKEERHKTYVLITISLETIYFRITIDFVHMHIDVTLFMHEPTDNININVSNL